MTTEDSHRASVADRVEDFFFAPASELPFVVLRIGLGTLLFVQALCVAHLTLELWSSSGLMQTELGDFLTGGDVLWFTGLRTLVRTLGIPEALWLRALFAAYVGSLVALVCVGKRAVAAAACVLHALLMAGGSLSSYGVDQFSQVALFALVICPGEWTRGQPVPVTERARFALRGLQGTLCLGYFTSGVAKAKGVDWFTGDAIYRALTLPLYRTIDTAFLIRHVWLAKLFSWGTLFLEIGYPALMAWRRTRRMAVVAVLAMHFGIGAFMQLQSFAIAMGLLTLCAFGVAGPTRCCSAGCRATAGVGRNVGVALRRRAD